MSYPDETFGLDAALKRTPPMRECDFCQDADATWVVDAEATFGGGENGPEHDELILRVACGECMLNHGSCCMPPEPITPAWLRYFDAPWSFYEAPYAKPI